MLFSFKASIRSGLTKKLSKKCVFETSTTLNIHANFPFFRTRQRNIQTKVIHHKNRREYISDLEKENYRFKIVDYRQKKSNCKYYSSACFKY